MTDILKALEYTGREGAARIEIESLRARVTELEADISEIPQICRRYERQLTELKAGQGDPFIWISQGLELSDHKRDGFRPLYTSAPNATDAELKLRYLIDIAYDHLLCAGYKEEDPTLTQLRPGLSPAAEYK